MSDERPASNEELRRLQERGVGGGPGPRHDQPRQDRGEPPRGGPAGGQGRGDDRGGGQSGPRGPGSGRPAPPGGRRDWGGGPPPGRGLPPDYLRGGYFDEGGYLRPELIVEQAREIAGMLAGANLNAAALRRFFGMTRRAESRLDAGATFEAVRGDVLALKPFAANAMTREVIPPVFREFIDRNVDRAVMGKEQFLRGFLPHFQYVVAYFPRK